MLKFGHQDIKTGTHSFLLRDRPLLYYLVIFWGQNRDWSKKNAYWKTRFMLHI